MVSSGTLMMPQPARRDLSRLGAVAADQGDGEADQGEASAGQGKTTAGQGHGTSSPTCSSSPLFGILGGHPPDKHPQGRT
jgi:hypothetical protein